MASKKEVVSFRKLVPKNSEIELKERIKADGTIEGVNVRFYAGQQKDLRVEVFIMHKGEKREDIITYPEGTDRFLSGDDDNFSFPATFPVYYDDYIKIQAKNVDPNFDYSLVVDVIIDYYMGANRVINGVM